MEAKTGNCKWEDLKNEKTKTKKQNKKTTTESKKEKHPLLSVILLIYLKNTSFTVIGIWVVT